MANDQERDHTQIGNILLLSRLLECIHIIFIVFCLSYVTGVGWYIFVDLANDGASNTFITSNDLVAKSNSDILIILTYFSFTTFSTVGFGDFHPISDQERLLGLCILLLGVMVTSFAMDKLRNMIDDIRELRNSHEEQG
mmetsp:Transcript_25435/g.39226  ORF Transcript_25435/g.39226 Transcript_25435/m.39226 type:complete len:139 (+) Transcript_25435:324-740(+)